MVEHGPSHGQEIAWIGGDWGTTSMRLYGFDANDRVAVAVTDGPGMNALDRDAFEPALIARARRIVPNGPIPPIILCGMVGSRQGWAEAPYLDLPAALEDIPANAAPVACGPPLSDVRILPGLASRDREQPDVIRGEETQALGYIAGNNARDVTLCMPGTHCKWLTLRNGTVVRSRTFMTGELFSLLASHSVLRHSLPPRDIDADAFADGARAGLRDPHLVLSKLFAIRSGDLLFGGDGTTHRGYLSGLLIGGEIAVALDETGGSPIAIVGAATLAARYRAAFELAGRTVTLTDGGDMVAAGLSRAFRRLHPHESPVTCATIP